MQLPVAGAGQNSPEFVGSMSCSSSSCHGGGGEHQNQYLVWSLRDFHSQRPVATLATARSKQIANALGIVDPTTDSRCTTCHAPLQNVPESLRGENFNAAEGVSCESCHGPAENWLRSHTRPDYTHADRVAAGMRDLQNLYVRANTCVACHQNVDSDILAAGHPELMFELDGQSVSEPKHWRETTNWNGAQAWFVGQAAALREMSWQLAREQSADAHQIDRFRGLVWLMMDVQAGNATLPAPPDMQPKSGANVFSQVQKWSDSLAMTAANISWTDDLSKTALKALVNSSGDFKSALPQSTQARHAERLVLGLDRLTGALPELKDNAALQAALNQLFADAQSRPDFDPKKFAADLDKFSQALGGK